MTPTALRDRVEKLAQENTGSALATANKIQDPWYRCQALAWVARLAPEKEIQGIIKVAIKVSLKATDPYKRVAVSAWPLRALIERNCAAEVESLLPELLQHASSIENPTSRVDALFLLWEAVFPMNGRARRDVQQALVGACYEAKSWKAGRALREMALILGQVDPSAAAAVAEGMPEGIYKRQAQTRLSIGEQHYPRQFFWEQSSSKGR